jgi:hypothetical protein
VPAQLFGRPVKNVIALLRDLKKMQILQCCVKGSSSLVEEYFCDRIAPLCRGRNGLFNSELVAEGSIDIQFRSCSYQHPHRMSSPFVMWHPVEDNSRFGAPISTVDGKETLFTYR